MEFVHSVNEVNAMYGGRIINLKELMRHKNHEVESETKGTITLAGKMIGDLKMRSEIEPEWEE
jgi:hypothetical protein